MGGGFRQVARAKKDSDSGGMSDVSIMSSVKASICSQLVFEEFLILVSFMDQCLSERAGLPPHRPITLTGPGRPKNQLPSTSRNERPLMRIVQNFSSLSSP